MTKKLKNRFGPWVTGEDFWDREREIDRLLELVKEGGDLLMVAPRRIGKTSLVREALRRLKIDGGFYGLFVDVQDGSTPEDLILAVSLAARAHQAIWKKILHVFDKFIGRALHQIDEIGIDVITLKLREGLAEDWRSKGDRILDELAAADKPVVLAIDELSLMVNRMLRPRSNQMTEESREKTGVFLSWLRKATGRHQGRIRWIVFGSIGIEPILSQAGLNHTIAHLRPFHLGPWDYPTADECLQALAAGAGISLPEGARREMLNRLGCNIPHHVQMYFGYVHDDCRLRGTTAPGAEDVIRVYNHAMLGTRGHAELADLEERLHRVLGRRLIALAFDLLTETAVSGALTSEAASILAELNRELAEANESEKALRTVLGVLEHDGYLKPRSPGDSVYVFVSNLTRDWWKHRFQLGYVQAGKRK